MVVDDACLRRDSYMGLGCQLGRQPSRTAGYFVPRGHEPLWAHLNPHHLVGGLVPDERRASFVFIQPDEGGYLLSGDGARGGGRRGINGSATSTSRPGCFHRLALCAL